jgi:hypothetical protein
VKRDKMGTARAGLAARAYGAQTEPLGGQPAPGAKQSFPDLEAQVAYQRAFEAVVWAMPATSIYRAREGAFKACGITDNEIIAWSKPSTPTAEMLTPNTITPYIAGFTDLRKGPVVLEIPAKSDKAVLFGQIADAWEVTIADVGPSGDDKGAGGKYLFLPPGYKDPIPAGYFPVQSKSYRLMFGFRSIPAPGVGDDVAYAYSKTLKLYPLADAANPKPTRFVDGSAYRVPMLSFYDSRVFQDIYDIVSVEPVRERDKVMMGMLASIGIEPGKPFNPQGKVKAAMERAAVDAYCYMQERQAKLASVEAYWPDSHWVNGMQPDAAGCGSSKLDPRELVGGFERLAIACLYGDADKCSAAARPQRTSNSHLAAVGIDCPAPSNCRARTQRNSSSLLSPLGSAVLDLALALVVPMARQPDHHPARDGLALAP